MTRELRFNKPFTLLLLSCLFIVSALASNGVEFAMARQVLNPTYQVAWSGEFVETQAPSNDQFFDWYRNQFSIDSKITWKEKKNDLDDLGMSHIRFDQYYNGVSVDHGTLIIHSINGVVKSFNGEIYTEFKTGASSEIHNGLNEYLSAYSDAVVTKTDIFTYALGSNGIMYLCNEMYVQSDQAGIYDKIWIRGENSDVVRVEPQLIHQDAKGKANTYYIGVQDIITDSLSSTSFRLRENARPIYTYNGALGKDFTDADNYWNNSGEKIATDVHYGTQLLHTFFDDKFGWDSYANKGDSMSSVINLNGGGNAYWNLAGNYATFLSKASSSVGPCAAIDVVGHEFGHGVGDENAGLVYSGESCMLHESLADITGTLLEWYHDTTKYDWLLGEKVWSGGIRNMQNPKSFKHPDTYKGQFFPNGCHGSGGVQNYWFYMMVKGDTGTNDNAHNYSVEGLGFEKAMAIMYRAVFYYWTSNTNFKEANTHSLQAAKDLYGSCSDELRITYEAWKAVGLEDTTFKIVDLSHSLVAPKLVCSVIPDTIRLRCTGDINRNVTWYFSNGDSAKTLVTDYVAKNTGVHKFILKTEICNITLWDTGYTTINYQPIAKYSYDKTMACNNGRDTIRTINTSINFDATKTLSYEWTVYPYGDKYSSKDLVMPIKDRFDLTFLLKSYYPGGCWDTVSHRLYVNNVPDVSFDVESACEKENIKLSNNTDTSKSTFDFTWQIDSKVVATGYNPNFNLNQEGSHTMTLTVLDKKTGCSASKTKSFTVFKNPLPTFTANNACSEQNMKLVHTTNHSSPPNYFRWHLPESKPFNKDSVFVSTGNKKRIPVRLEFKDQRGCFGVTEDTIDIEQIMASFNSANELCVGDNFEAVSTTKPILSPLTWYVDGQPSGTDTLLSLVPAKADSVLIKLVATGSKCSSVFERNIIVHALPEPTFDIEDDICDGGTANVTNTTKEASNYTFTWLWGDGNSSGGDTTSHVYNNQTSGVTETYNLQLRAISSFGCNSKKTEAITVNGNPICLFTFEETDKRLIAFVPQNNTGSNSYKWDFGDGDTSDEASPSHQYLSKGAFTVELIIVDDKSCTSSCSEELAIGWGVSVNNVIDNKLAVAPNPSDGNFEFRGLTNSKTKVTIIDASGKIVFAEDIIPVNGKVSMHLYLASGVYTSVVMNDEGLSYNKVVISR